MGREPSERRTTAVEVTTSPVEGGRGSSFAPGDAGVLGIGVCAVFIAAAIALARGEERREGDFVKVDIHPVALVFVGLAETRRVL